MSERPAKSGDNWSMLVRKTHEDKAANESLHRTMATFTAVGAAVMIPVAAAFFSQRYRDSMRELGKHYLPRLRSVGPPGQ